MSTTYDIVRIKELLPPLSELLEKDGHTLRRSGSAMFMRCAFHEEKSASCHVDDATGRFHCFGCGAGGDAFDFYQQSRGLSFQEALAALAGIAGVGPQMADTPMTRPAPKPLPAEEALPDPMSGADLARWQEACDRLLASEAEISRIAEWRGIDPECVRWAAGRGLMGSYTYWGVVREAFLVEMPAPQGGGLLPVSVHCRLAAGSRGNELSGKQAWHFTPKKRGAWPFIIGNLATADYIFALEGQWDALALVSMMGWHRKEEWPSIALVGLRGATSGAKLLLHEINPKAQVIAFADADLAGSGWFVNKGDLVWVKDREHGRKQVEAREDGLLTKLHGRCRAVTAFWPTTDKTDLNDLIKSGELTRPLLLAYIQPLMVTARTKPKGPTFARWCKAKVKTTDPVISRAALFVTLDKKKPTGRRPLRAWETHWRKSKVPEDLFGDLALTWNQYRADCAAN